MGRIISHKYEELEHLGQGGQAEVYKVRHVDHKTILALKVVRSHLLGNAEMISRFEREAVLMTRLRHRNIVRVLGSGWDEDLDWHYIVMEYVEGKTLKQYLREKGALPLAEVLEIARQVAHALDYAHNQIPPIIHRDIKPSNIMLEDLSGRAVVLDFGIAKELNNDESINTRTGMMMGTWRYASPEQLRREPLTGSADVYSLGLVMYELYTGAQFYAGVDEYAVLGKVLHDPNEHEPSFSRPTPQAFVTLVAKAIAKTREKRYPRMADFLHDLEACWLVLDETRTQMAPPVTRGDLHPTRGRDRIEEIEEEIRKLERERQLRALSLLEGQIREARARAERTGAKQWATALFEQGISQEERGRISVQEAQYALAQEAYTTALETFLRAAAAAATVAVQRQTEQLRQAVQTTKADAERYGARERARVFYNRALALQGRGEELWEQGNYEQARQVYGEARSLFEDARDLAYRESLKGEAEAARAQAQSAKEKALQTGASELAATLVTEAIATEQQAEAALDQDEFAKACTLFQRASQQYDQAQRRSQRERQRQILASFAQQVSLTQQQLVEVGVRETEPTYQQALASQHEAQVYINASEYTRAEAAYERARELFAEARRIVERERRQQAVALAREQFVNAQVAAAQVEASLHLPAAWSEAEKMAALARHHEESEQFEEAVTLYLEVAQSFARLQQEAIEVIGRASVEPVKQQMLTLQEQSAALQEWVAADAWNDAQQWERQAVLAYETRDYQQAKELYQKATGAYANVKHAAEMERDRQAEERRAAVEKLRQQAAQMRQEAEQAKSQAEDTDAPARAQSQYTHACATYQEAEHFRHQEEFEQASQSYRQAKQEFIEVQRLAERTAQQEASKAARRELQTARHAAEEAQAEVWAVTTWQAALATENEANIALQQQDFIQACTLFLTAQSQYEQAHQQAETEHQRQRQSAISAAENAQAALAHAVALELSPSSTLYEQALANQRQAEDFFASQNYTSAVRAYGQAQTLYEEAVRVTEYERHRQAMIVAFQQMTKAREDAVTVEAEKYLARSWSEAEHLVATAQQYEITEELTRAEELYRQATQCFMQLRTDAIIQALYVQAVAARQQMLACKAQGNPLRQWAETLWITADEQETYAEQAFNNKDYPQAVAAYEQATESYQQAITQAEREQEQHEQEQLAAAAALLSRVEQLRQQAEEAHNKADAVAAMTYVPDLYSRALTLEADATALWDACMYEQAEDAYSRARDAFLHIQQEARKAELITAQSKTQAAKGAAARANAETFASQLFHSALVEEEQAEAAYQAGDWAQAQELFGKAQQIYTEAREEAQAERQRQRDKAVAAAQSVQAAREHAQKVGVSLDAHPMSRQGQEIYLHAQRLFAAQAYIQATEEYERAQRRYEDATQDVEHERQRQAALQSRNQMEAALRAATQVGVEKRFVMEWAEIQQDIQTATGAEQQEEFITAASFYTEVTHQLVQLQQATEEKRAQEETEALAKEVHTAKMARELLAKWAGTVWAEAERHEEHADLAYQERNYKQAQTLYRLALQTYRQAKTQAEQEQRDEVAAIFRQAEVALHKCHTEKQKAEHAAAPQYAPSLFTQALSLYEQGNADWQSTSYERATQRYEEALRVFAAARTLAIQEALREEAAELHTQAQQAREKAVHENAETFALDAFQEATSSEQQALAAFRREDFVQARDQFQVAVQQYEQAQDHARNARYRRQVQSVEQHLQAAQQRLTIIGITSASRVLIEQAREAQQQAESHLATKAYRQVEEAYHRAVELSEEAVRVAECEHLQQETSQARQHMKTAQQNAEQAGAAQRFAQEWTVLGRRVEEAHQSEQVGEFQYAATLYSQAARHYIQLQEDAERQAAQEKEQHRQDAFNAHQQAERSRKAAEEKEAQRYAQEPYAIAMQTLQEGARCLATEMWEKATSHFMHAQALFSQAQEHALREKDRQATEAARIQAYAVYEEVRTGRGTEIFPERFAEGARVLAAADEALQQENFAPAQVNFERSRILFHQISNDVTLHGQREQTEKARAHAQELQTKVGKVKGAQQKQASKAFAQGERLLQKGKYLEALTSYNTAVALWTVLLQEQVTRAATSRVSLPQTKTVSVPSIGAEELHVASPYTYIRYFTVGAALCTLLVVFYVIRPSVETPPPSTPPRGQETPTPGPALSLPPIPSPAGEGIGTRGVPPLRLRTTPTENAAIKLKEGDSQTFTVEVEGETTDALQYAWSIDGKRQPEPDATLSYQPTFDDGGTTPKTIEVVVTDSGNHTVTHQWQVQVQNVNRPPQIKTFLPRTGVVNMSADETQNFTIDMNDPDREDRLAAVWFLDGTKVSEGKQWQFRAPASSGSHIVTVTVTDVEGLKVEQAWNIAVQERAPLKIARVLPDPGRELLMKEGESLPFAITLENTVKGPLRYSWRVDGREQRVAGNKWVYQPGFDEGGEQAKTVEVNVTDSAKNTLRQLWQVQVQNVNRPPTIVTLSPRQRVIEVAPGAVQEFAIEATDPDRDDRLAYLWKVDGQEETRERQWQFQTPTTPGTYVVSVDVADSEGLKRQQEWQVLVKVAPPPPQPPVWSYAEPRQEKIRIEAGDPLEFAVKAKTAGTDPSEPRYQWSINGTVQDLEAGQFRFPATAQAGTYQVDAIAISPDGYKSSVKQWTVEVAPRRPVEPILTQQEVSNWLETYRRAYEEKNVNRLVELGTLDPAVAPRLTQQLAPYRDYRAEIVDVDIRREGARASVTFKRVDTLNGITQTTALISFGLEKGADGRINVVRK